MGPPIIKAGIQKLKQKIDLLAIGRRLSMKLRKKMTASLLPERMAFSRFLQKKKFKRRRYRS
jgi:hypothetical protein